MARKFLEQMYTPSVRAAQAHYFNAHLVITPGTDHDPLRPDEIEFITTRDSFYLATVSEENWPYIQHRGGPPGFLHVFDERHIGFLDFKGNRQMLSTGNLAQNDRVCLFLMDYPQRTRLKILGHAKVLDAREHPDLVATFPVPEDKDLVERIFQIEILSFDWNCPKFITPRYTAPEVQEAVQPLKDRIAELEQKLAALSGSAS